MEYLLPIAAYLLGSIPAAIVVAKAFRLADPRSIGSHNPGATNILRYGGKTAAAVTLAGDIVKGFVAVGLARYLLDEAWATALTAFAVFLGHAYPVFFRFHGGKGVATALGVWLALVPSVGALLLLTWLAVAALFRYSSLAALAAAGLAPVYVWRLTPQSEYLLLSVAMSALLIWRHRTNIVKLAAGTEGRIGATTRSAADR